jgi:uncharacterized damage-inducible protein DinB
MFRYHRWANDRILAAAQKINLADYFSDNDYGRGGLHAILFHILRTDNGWRTALEDSKLQLPLKPEDYPDLVSIQAGMDAENAAMQAYLEGLSEQQLESEIPLTSPRGAQYTFLLWRALMHLILHGMQHRSEAAGLLTRYGQSPGDLDFIFFDG